MHLCFWLWFFFQTIQSQVIFKQELGLPVKGTSQRVTQRPVIKPNETFVFFDQAGPGCLLHWWLTCNRGKNPETGKDWAHQLRLRFFYDGAEKPSINMTLAKFFMIMMQNSGKTTSVANPKGYNSLKKLNV